MSINRNKGEDRFNTGKMCNESPRDLSSTYKNWLDHSGACAKIDSMLLQGASFTELLTSGRKPSAVRSHLYHLKAEHGLTTTNDGGVYYFSVCLDSVKGQKEDRKKTNQKSNVSKEDSKLLAKLPINSNENSHQWNDSLQTDIKKITESTGNDNARKQLIAIVCGLAEKKRDVLENLKKESSGLERDDFIWHYLLQSFSTMGRASGWHGLIGNVKNYQRVTYSALSALSLQDRINQVRLVCNESGIRMPTKKAEYIIGCFNHVNSLGGLEAAKSKLLAKPGREGKIRFLQTFPGIGPKYARNIMMDVYHKDFRDSIAIDSRIKAISEMLGISFSSYSEHEAFYLGVAKDAGINGWELDRLLFNFKNEIENQLRNKGFPNQSFKLDRAGRAIS